MCDIAVQGEPLQIPEPLSPDDMRRMKEDNAVPLGYGYAVRRRTMTYEDSTLYFWFVLTRYGVTMARFHSYYMYDPEVCFQIEAFIMRRMLQKLASRR